MDWGEVISANRWPYQPRFTLVSQATPRNTLTIECHLVTWPPVVCTLIQYVALCAIEIGYHVVCNIPLTSGGYCYVRVIYSLSKWTSCFSIIILYQMEMLTFFSSAYCAYNSTKKRCLSSPHLSFRNSVVDMHEHIICWYAYAYACLSHSLFPVMLEWHVNDPASTRGEAVPEGR